MSNLELAFLGSPEVKLCDNGLKFRSRKALALLCYLVAEGSTRSREELGALFWPESDESRGRTALRSTLAYIKEPLTRGINGEEEPYLLIDRNVLGFNFASDYRLDLDLLRSAFNLAQRADQADKSGQTVPLLEAAVEAYRGDFMQGFYLNDTPEFDYWLDVEREAWRRRMDQVFDQLSQIRMANGDIGSTIEILDRWVRHSRLNEIASSRLMEARSAAGDRVGALETYESLRATLSQEIGVSPDPATEALAERLKRDYRPSVPHGRQPSRESQDQQPPVHAPKAPELPFVGRSAEFGDLVSSYRKTETNGAQLVAVIGEGGVGKTRLVEEFLGWAYAEGAGVLQGRAFETEEHLPYGVLVDALRSRLEEERAPDDLLPDVWLSELTRLLPELKDRYPDLPEPASDESTARTGLFESVARLIEAFSKNAPVVLFIEDSHRADKATLDALSYAERRWPEAGCPVLVVVSLRPEAVGADHTATEWISGLERDVPVSRLVLDPLTLADTKQLLRELSPEYKDKDAGPLYELERFATWLHDETEGKPFFISETLKTLVDRGALVAQPSTDGRWLLETAESAREAATPDDLLPKGVRDLISARLGELSPVAFELFVAGAVLGRRFTFEQLFRISNVPENKGLSGLDELLTRRLLVKDTGGGTEEAQSGPEAGYSFAHEKIRAVTYSDAGDERLRTFHRRALEVLGEGSTPTAELARHAEMAGLSTEAFRYNAGAGNTAMELSAARDAIASYESTRRLLNDNLGGPQDLWTTLSLDEIRSAYVRLGEAYEMAEEWDEARHTYEQLLERARETGEPSLHWPALVRLATLTAWKTSDSKTAEAFLEEALQVAEANEDESGLAEIEWNLSQVKFFTEGPHRALEHAGKALSLSRKTGLDELSAHSLFTLAYFGAYAGDWASVPTHAVEAREKYTSLQEDIVRPETIKSAGFFHFSFFAGPQPSRLVDHRAMEAESLVFEGLGQVHLGWPEDGAKVARRALEIGSAINSGWIKSGAFLVLTAALIEAGEYEAALRAAESGLELEGVDHSHLPFRLLASGAVLQALLRLEEAHECYEKALTEGEDEDSSVVKMRSYEIAGATWLCANRALAGDWQAAHAHALQASTIRLEMPVSALFADLVRHHETEALLSGGDRDLAWEGARRFGELAGDNPRYRMCQLRQLAALEQWEGSAEKAVEHLLEAARLAEDLYLPGEQWQIKASLGATYSKLGDASSAKMAYSQATYLIRRLSEKITDQSMREDFLESPLVQRVFEGCRDSIHWTTVSNPGIEVTAATHSKWAAGS